jgi:LEA14-like dessication related protein
MKKLIVIILVSATILNIAAGTFIFLDIQTMELPVTTLTLELTGLSADEALLRTTLQINNTNGFSLSIQNVSVITTTDNGDIIAQLFIAGGDIQSHENKTFSMTTAVRFNGTIPNTLTSRITGTLGVLFFGLVKKTLPLKFSLVTSLNKIVTQLALPHIHLDGNFSDITQEGVNFTSSVTIDNPYTFDFAIENLSVSVVTETGINVGNISLQGATIPAKTSQQLTGNGRLLLKALNAKTLYMNLQGNVTILVAGIRKTINLSIAAEIIPPQIKQLLSNLPTEASLTGHYKITLKGLFDQITFKIVNPNRLTFLATNVTVQIYRVDRNKTRLISNGTLPDRVIFSQTTTNLTGNMTIPYSHLLPHVGERFFADQLQVILRANFTIQGLNQTIWIGMIGYQDFPFHRLFS